MRGWSRIWLAAVAAVVVAACGNGGTSSHGAPPHNNVLIVGASSDPYSLDPGNAVGVSDLDVGRLIYDTLLRADPATGKLGPDLATSWGYTDPGRLTFRLNLRHGVSFQDGTPFDAQAVKTSIEHYKVAGFQTDMAPVSSVSVADQYTLDLHLAGPYSPLPAVLTQQAGMVISPTALAKYGKDYASHPVGTGPFVLQSRRPQIELVLTRNAHYWQKGQPKLAGIDWKVIADPTSLVNALQARQVDFASLLNPADLPVVRRNSNLNVKVVPTAGPAMIVLDTGLPPISSQLVRQAMNMSVDRQALSDALNGKGVGAGPASQYLAPSNWAYSKDQTPYKHDPAQARQLLAQAGFPNGVTINLCNPTTVPQQAATIEKQQLAEANITLNISVEPLLSCGVKMNVQKSLQAFQLGYGGAVDPYLAFYNLFGSHGSYNPLNTSYPNVDSLLSQIAATPGQQAQKPLYEKLNRAVFDAAPDVPLYYLVNVEAASTRVAGLAPDFLGRVQLQGASFT
jgi:peptide/nickel transport system substrate-binding protein